MQEAKIHRAFHALVSFNQNEFAAIAAARRLVCTPEVSVLVEVLVLLLLFRLGSSDLPADLFLFTQTGFSLIA